MTMTRGIPSSPLQNWNDDTTGRGIPLLAVLKTLPKPLPAYPIIQGALAGVGGDVAVWITGVGCNCGWCGLRVLVDVTLAYEVGLSGAGRRHDDVAGNCGSPGLVATVGGVGHSELRVRRDVGLRGGVEWRRSTSRRRGRE